MFVPLLFFDIELQVSSKKHGKKACVTVKYKSNSRTTHTQKYRSSKN